MTVDSKNTCSAHAATEAMGGEQPRTLVQLLRHKAARHPDRRLYTFLADGESEEAYLTYGELDRRARAVAALLQQSHARGERALLLYPAGLDFIAAFFGCLYAGIVPVPTYPPHPARLNRTPEKLLALLHDAQPSLALTNTELLTKSAVLQSQLARVTSLKWLATDNLKDDAQEAWRDPQVDERTLAFLQYTSGSTAAPKGVMVSHGNLLHNQRMIKAAFAQTEESVVVGWLPLYHDMGLIGNVLHPLYVGASCLLMSPLSFVQRPLRWLQAITKYRATTSGGPDFAYQLCARKITQGERELLDLSSWRVAFNGAEPIRSETLDLFTATFSSCGFRREAWFPCYGLAESTLFVAGGVKEESRLTRAFQTDALEQGRVIEESTPDARSKTLVSCGRPSAEQRVIIVDPSTLSERPALEVGEIWTSSESVALGYWNRETETEETFHATLAGQNKGPFLRTGDLGFLHEGELFVTGRHKDLIIIRGRNFYPQDIEQTVERCHALLRANSGAAFSIESDGGELLVVLQELDPRHAGHEMEESAQAIRQAVALQHELKIYDVLLLKAGSIPKTSSGKTQRRACRELYLSGSLDIIHRDTLAESTAWLPPDETIADLSSTSFENPLDLPTDERVEALDAYLLDRLSGVLGLSSSRLHREQSVNAIGLDSLGALELKGRIETELGLDIPLTKFLDDSTIADLTAFLLDEAASKRMSRSDIQPIARSEKSSQYKLSSGQRALWFMHQLAPESSAYIIARAVRILSPLDEDALRRAFQAIVNRHASLRTTFITREGEPLQQVSDEALISFVAEDGSGWSDERLRERLAEAAYQPFDLESGPLLRVHLFKRAVHEHILLLSVHHIVSDFWSIGLLVHELGQLYDAHATGQPPALEFLDLQFRDYVAWERETLAGIEGERLWDFWREQLAGELPVLNLQTDYPRPPVQTYKGSAQSFKLGRELTEQLKVLSREEGSTLYVALLAVFNILLFRYTGQPEILVGSPTSGRHRAGFRNLIGYFVNPLVHRSFPDGDKSFQTFLQEVRRTVLLGLEHQDFPFPLLVERLQLSRDTRPFRRCSRCKRPRSRTIIRSTRWRYKATASLSSWAN
jgi:acyl-CoA synthetase (AMP-forming)/AMP-acid ligase II/acyl carrier protein